MPYRFSFSFNLTLGHPDRSSEDENEADFVDPDDWIVVGDRRRQSRAREDPPPSYEESAEQQQRTPIEERTENTKNDQINQCLPTITRDQLPKDSENLLERIDQRLGSLYVPWDANVQLDFSNPEVPKIRVARLPGKAPRPDIENDETLQELVSHLDWKQFEAAGKSARVSKHLKKVQIVQHANEDEDREKKESARGTEENDRSKETTQKNNKALTDALNAMLFDNSRPEQHTGEPKSAAENEVQEIKKKVRYIRHRLQREFLTPQKPPQADRMEAMNADFIKLETEFANLHDVDPEMARQTRVSHVLKGIHFSAREIPDEETYRFRERAAEILAQWHIELKNPPRIAGVPMTDDLKGRRDGMKELREELEKLESAMKRSQEKDVGRARTDREE